MDRLTAGAWEPGPRRSHFSQGSSTLFVRPFLKRLAISAPAFHYRFLGMSPILLAPLSTALSFVLKFLCMSFEDKNKNLHYLKTLGERWKKFKIAKRSRWFNSVFFFYGNPVISACTFKYTVTLDIHTPLGT